MVADMAILMVSRALACAAVLGSATGAVGQGLQVRLKEVLDLHDIRPNTLTGRGLITGLKGTGDGTVATRQALVSFLTRMKLKVRTDQVASGNIALVSVTATLPSFARHGTRLLVQVQAIGEATSLRGGTLLLTELRGSDDEVYALASGPLVVGGFTASGRNARVTQNHPTAGTIPGGGICEPAVEALLPNIIDEHGEISFLIRRPSAGMAYRVQRALSELLRRKNCGFARIDGPGNVRIGLSRAYRTPDAYTPLLAEIEELRVTPEIEARILVDERRGTIVVGGNVTLSPCLVQVADLTIQVSEEDLVSQPRPLSNGKTSQTTLTSINVAQDSGKPTRLGGAASLDDLIQGLRSLGIDGGKMITVLTALHDSGNLHGRLEAR